ncbi:MAG TPA: cytochrome-c oxidase, cbb3-type subunit II [Gammaproteobacteria bacterium]|nr:cytochrome-c oxidase, cbb3-type subunit II [Gammaproteobacteria bacterium]
MKHEFIERKVGIMAVLIVLVISIGGLVEIVPLIFDSQVRDPAAGVEPYPALELAGRDIYIREGCYGCHSQMIRPFRAETERYGHYSLAGESVYDRPFQFGSKRTGPDLARVGGLYSDEWHRLHLNDPRLLVPESNMPAYPWLEQRELSSRDVEHRMRALRRLGHPYSDDDIGSVADTLSGKTEMDAVIAYLQGLGTNLGRGRQ